MMPLSKVMIPPTDDSVLQRNNNLCHGSTLMVNPKSKYLTGYISSVFMTDSHVVTVVSTGNEVDCEQALSGGLMWDL